MIRTLFLAAVACSVGMARAGESAGDFVNNMRAGSRRYTTSPPISWLATQLETITNDPAIPVLGPASACGDTAATEWRAMETTNGTFNFTGLNQMLAVQHANGAQFVILKIHRPPPDVDAVGWAVPSPSNYVTRISRLVAHLAAHTTTATSGLWIIPDNEPDHTPAGFDRHAAVLKACWQASQGRLKIVGCVLQDRRPQCFAELAERGCTNWCDAVSFHYYNSWEMAPDLPGLGGKFDTVYNDVRAIAANFPGKPIFCDEFGVALNTERTRKAILMMLAAGVQMILPFDWTGDMTHPGDDVSRFHGDEPYAFYPCWNVTSNRPAPWAQCVVDLAGQIGSNPKATLSRTPSGRYEIKFSNGAVYSWNTNGLGPIDYYVVTRP